MKVLIACEESQTVCKEFRALGHEAYSCDTQPCSGGHPEWHIKGNVIPLLDGNCEFTDELGGVHRIYGEWNLIIAHPPCTYLTCTGNRWFDTAKYGEAAKKRYTDRYKAIVFFMYIARAKCKRICIENPVGVMSSCYMKPQQIIHPYMFGDAAEKKTCLWLKGLPLLEPMNPVAPPPRRVFDSGKTMPMWYADAWSMPKEQRAAFRSKTFPGFAKAMATQWGSLPT